MKKLLMWIVCLSIPLLSLSQVSTDSINVITNIKGDTLIVITPYYLKVWHKTILQLKECEDIQLILNKQIITYDQITKRQENIIDTLKQETGYLRKALIQCDTLQAINNRELNIYKEEVIVQKRQKHLWQVGTGLAVLILIISLL